MIILVPETGPGDVGANSYVSLAYAEEYFDGHPFYADAWADIVDVERKERLLITASQQLDVLFNWEGYRATETQGLDWPRYGVRDKEGGYLPDDALPDRLMRATCEMAYYLTRGDPAAISSSAGVSELRIDVIELTFDKSVRTAVVPSSTITLLRGLGEYANGSRVRRVVV